MIRVQYENDPDDQPAPRSRTVVSSVDEAVRVAVRLCYEQTAAREAGELTKAEPTETDERNEP